MTTDRRAEDDADCERFGCEDRTHPVHHHDPFDPARHAQWLETLGHKPLPDGRCEHRWRNRTVRAVRCAFLDGFRAALSAPEER